MKSATQLVRHTISRLILPAPPGLQAWVVWEDPSEGQPEDAVRAFNVLLMATAGYSQSELNPPTLFKRKDGDHWYAGFDYLEDALELKGAMSLDCSPVHVYLQVDVPESSWWEIGRTAWWTREGAVDAAAEQAQEERAAANAKRNGAP